MVETGEITPQRTDLHRGAGVLAWGAIVVSAVALTSMGGLALFLSPATVPAMAAIAVRSSRRATRVAAGFVLTLTLAEWVVILSNAAIHRS
jgi:hypothetical protein